MEILSWNIQAGRGTDDVTDIKRIAAIIREMGDPDVICLQEVAQNFPDVEGGADQVAQLTACFPGYQVFFGAALDRLVSNGRARFGNLILSRLDVLQLVLHKLPQPVDQTTKSMPRQAIEVIVGDGLAVYRIITTHLDYFSSLQRAAQANRLYEIYQESLQRARLPSPGWGDKTILALPETANTVICGDFNFELESPEYQRLTGSASDDDLLDAWRIVHGDTEHAATCGIYDHVQWTQGAHCRDFFFVSAALKNQVSEMVVDVDTNASDHQPLKLVVS